ncbi:MAG: hypothetical protein ACI8RD_002337 [Bacillariaceae sp.]|jgi:hypothetical protein
MRRVAEQQKSSRLFDLASLSSLILFLTVSNIIVSSPLVSSSSTYNAYNYDQTTPQFTPDGRLLQVEYASAAADLSPPLIVLECFSSSSSNNSKDINNQQDACLILLTVRKQANSPQNRIVIMDDKDEHQQSKKRGGSSSSSSSSSKSFPYCCVMSGILSDSLCLLQVGMKVAAEHSLRYQTSLGMVALTQALADECQSRVFGGGLRPYGSTLMLCGYDKMYDEEETEIILEGDDDDEFLSTTSSKRNSNMNKHHRRIPLFYQTDPSGGIIQHHAAQNSASNSDLDQRKKSRRRYRNDNNNDDDDDDDNTIIRSQVRCIVGGSQSLQRQLYKKINLGMAEFEHQHQQQQHNRQEVLSLADRIANLAKILTKEMNNDNNNSKASGVSKSSRNKDDDSSSLPSLCPLEVVVISPKLGCHRLDNKQIQAIQKLINDDNKIAS